MTIGSPTRIWDIASAREITSLPEDIATLAASADRARFLTATPSSETRVRDAQSLQILRTWNMPERLTPLRAESGRLRSSTHVGPADTDPRCRQRCPDHCGSADRACLGSALGAPNGILVVVYNVGGDIDYRLVLHNATAGERLSAISLRLCPSAINWRTERQERLADGDRRDRMPRSSAYSESESECRPSADDLPSPRCRSSTGCRCRGWRHPRAAVPPAGAHRGRRRLCRSLPVPNTVREFCSSPGGRAYDRRQEDSKITH